jgi:hypothetical protein
MERASASGGACRRPSYTFGYRSCNAQAPNASFACGVVTEVRRGTVTPSRDDRRGGVHHHQSFFASADTFGRRQRIWGEDEASEDVHPVAHDRSAGAWRSGDPTCVATDELEFPAMTVPPFCFT